MFYQNFHVVHHLHPGIPSRPNTGCGAEPAADDPLTRICSGGNSTQLRVDLEGQTQLGKVEWSRDRSPGVFLDAA
jgi:hypothetical protein